MIHALFIWASRNIRWQIAAEWLETSQLSQMESRPILISNTRPRMHRSFEFEWYADNHWPLRLPLPQIGVSNAHQGPTSRRMLPPAKYDSRPRYRRDFFCNCMCAMSPFCRISLSVVVWLGYRQRTRTVLRHSHDLSLPCPHLNEYQSCEYPPCYRWKTTPSSPCRLKYPDMQCGDGMRNRTVECVSVLGVRPYTLLFQIPTYLLTYLLTRWHRGVPGRGVGYAFAVRRRMVDISR